MPTRKREDKRHKAFMASIEPNASLVLTEPAPPLGSIQVQTGKTLITVKQGKRQIELLKDDNAILRNIFVIDGGIPKWVSIRA